MVNQLPWALEHGAQVSIPGLLWDKHLLHLRHPPVRNSESSSDHGSGILQLLCNYFINKSNTKNSAGDKIITKVKFLWSLVQSQFFSVQAGVESTTPVNPGRHNHTKCRVYFQVFWNTLPHTSTPDPRCQAQLWAQFSISSPGCGVGLPSLEQAAQAPGAHSCYPQEFIAVFRMTQKSSRQLQAPGLTPTDHGI